MRIAKLIKTVNTHTQGEPTRIVISGLPYIKKNSIMEIKEEIIKNHDYIRKILMNEPRGHSGMFGAILIPPVDDDCDYGAIFMDTRGYLNMCGHGSIGIAKYAVEAGLINIEYPVTKIRVNTPAGRVNLEVNFNRDKEIKSISLINVKSFNYLSDLEINIPFGNIKNIPMDVAFGGNFFGIIDADEIGLNCEIENLEQIVKLGMEILSYAQKNVRVKHPKNEKITSIDLIQFNSRLNLKQGIDNRNVVVFGKYEYDRSPCGTGTAAKIANLFSKGSLKKGDKFINESIIGTKFIGEIITEDRSDGIHGIIPRITGNAYITSYDDYILEEKDPFPEGFLLK